MKAATIMEAMLVKMWIKAGLFRKTSLRLVLWRLARSWTYWGFWNHSYFSFLPPAVSWTANPSAKKASQDVSFRSQVPNWGTSYRNTADFEAASPIELHDAKFLGLEAPWPSVFSSFVLMHIGGD
ncbi:hypothetical protein C8J57DRAFT_1257218 [Mycena rebaudengoi]|nr:hypothetical protein C8J57DRAFT_1257218 [Mycena rebaudengoi]